MSMASAQRGGKCASRHGGGARRHRSGNGRERLAPRPIIGQGCEQSPGIGMPGATKDALGIAFLHDPAHVQDRNPVAGFCNQSEIMGDEQHGQGTLALELQQEFQDLSLNGDIERRGRLVGDDQVGLGRERHRQHDPLLHAAGELVGVLIDDDRRIGKSQLSKQLHRPSPGRLARGDSVSPHDAGELPSHGEQRIERGRGVLKHHRDASPSQPAHCRLALRQQVLTVVEDLASAHDSTRLWHEAHDRAPGDGLAASGLADDSEDPALFDGEAHSPHRVHVSLRGGEAHPQVVDRQHRPARQALVLRVCGLVATCTASPSRLKDMMVTNRARPGKVGTHQWPVAT